MIKKILAHKTKCTIEIAAWLRGNVQLNRSQVESIWLELGKILKAIRLLRLVLGVKMNQSFG